MKNILLGNSGLACSRLAYGCWRIAGSWNPAEVTPETQAAGRRAVASAYEAGYTLFDLADIYCDGWAETILGQALQETPAMRAGMVIATKCGIRKAGEPMADAPYRFDFSAAHIEASCESSLRRLGIETIDLYQLHRPDYLMHPEEIAEAFVRLKAAGKVREFGVSNFRPSQVSALQKTCPMRLMVNQVEISLARLATFEDGTLDQCLAEKIIPLAWSPLAGGQLGDGARRLLPSQEDYRIKPVVAALDMVGKKYGVNRTVLALAWLLKHPSNIIPIVGSTNPTSIRQARRALEIDLSREDWYRLLEAARGERLP